MNKRKLVFGVGILLILIGALLAAVAPGGLLNGGTEASIITPIGTIKARESPRLSVGVIAGYFVLAIGGVTLVIGYAMKSPPSS